MPGATASSVPGILADAGKPAPVAFLELGSEMRTENTGACAFSSSKIKAIYLSATERVRLRSATGFLDSLKRIFLGNTILLCIGFFSL
jgi:hypothetical protein